MTTPEPTTDDGSQPGSTSDDRRTGPTLNLRYNENPLGPSPAAIEAVLEAAPEIHRYPVDPYDELIDALAEHHGVTTEQVWIGPGAAGIIFGLSDAFLSAGDTALCPDPGFSLFRYSCERSGGAAVSYQLDREDGFELDPATLLAQYDGARLIHINTPHNPTGAIVTSDTIETIVTETDPETIVILDEAYEAFTDTPSRVPLVNERDDVIVTRSLSKSHGLAGMRIGYAVVPPRIAEEYGRVVSPFSVSGLSAIAARAALDDTTHLERTIAVARWGRRYLHDELNGRTWPSEANFVLLEVDDATAFTETLESRGILVRDGSSSGLADCVRISVGTPEETRVAVDEINRVIERCASP